MTIKIINIDEFYAHILKEDNLFGELNINDLINDNNHFDFFIYQDKLPNDLARIVKNDENIKPIPEELLFCELKEKSNDLSSYLYKISWEINKEFLVGMESDENIKITFVGILDVDDFSSCESIFSGRVHIQKISDKKSDALTIIEYNRYIEDHINDKISHIIKIINENKETNRNFNGVKDNLMKLVRTVMI